MGTKKQKNRKDLRQDAAPRDIISFTVCSYHNLPKEHPQLSTISSIYEPGENVSYLNHIIDVSVSCDAYVTYALYQQEGCHYMWSLYLKLSEP